MLPISIDVSEDERHIVSAFRSAVEIRCQVECVCFRKAHFLQFEITGGVKMLRLHDAVTQCYCFGAPHVYPIQRIAELGAHSTRELNAFMTLVDESRWFLRQRWP